MLYMLFMYIYLYIHLYTHTPRWTRLCLCGFRTGSPAGQAGQIAHLVTFLDPGKRTLAVGEGAKIPPCRACSQPSAAFSALAGKGASRRPGGPLVVPKSETGTGERLLASLSTLWGWGPVGGSRFPPQQGRGRQDCLLCRGPVH